MPKSITFERFDHGLDLRKGASTSDANRLRVLKNAHVTEGRTIRKRPGTERITTLEAGTTGLFAGNGVLNTFYGNVTTITHANALFEPHHVQSPTTAALELSEVHNAEVFNGYMYAAVEYTSGELRHHYLDGAAVGATHIADANCPNTVQLTKISSKLWAVGTTGETVRFCATNAPRDWTTADDAGFLPVSLQQSGSNQATGLGFYSKNLVVLFSDSSQIWSVDVDPALHAFLQSVDVGSILPYSHANMAGDVFFLSPAGVRTITRQDITTNLIDDDVGSPIDRELIKGTYVDITQAKAQFYRGGGQYWLYAGNKAVVYTFSRTAGVAAWAEYEFPYPLDYIAELNAELYIRTGNDVYKLNKSVFTDDGELYQVDVELAYLDFKSPGILKQILGMDVVTTGECQLSHRFDPRNTDLITNPPVTINGDTRPGNIRPVELLATSISPVISNYTDEDFELHLITYYYENLGTQ